MTSTTRAAEAAASSPPPGDRAASALPRLDSLTGLRFFAALAVFVHHVSGSGGRTGFSPIPHTEPYTQYGPRGVIFFFVLSGFVLTWSWRPGDRARHFYWRRFARIYPMHLVATALAIPVFYQLSHQKMVVRPLLASVVLLQSWFPNNVPTFPGNGVSWSLSDEMLFYAVFPVAVLLLARASGIVRSAAIAVLLVVTVVVGHEALVSIHDIKLSEFLLRTPVYRLPEFLLGIVIALAVRNGARVRGSLFLPLAVIAAWVYVFFHPELMPAGVRGWREPVDYAVSPLLFGWLIAVAASQDLSGRSTLLRSRPLVLLGAWSYAFYLVHQTLIRYAVVTWGFRPAHWHNVLFVIVLALCAVALAALLYYTVESPVERRLRGLLKRRDRHAVRDSAVLEAGHDAVSHDGGHRQHDAAR